MSDAKTDAAPAPSKKGKLLVILVVVLLVAVLAVGGLLAWFIFAKPADGGADEAVAEAQGGHDEGKKKDKDKKKKDAHDEHPPIFEKLQAEPFTVNLTGESESVLSVEIFVEIPDEETKNKLKNYQPKIQSAVIRLIGSKTIEEVRTSKGQEELARQIREKINEILGAEGKDEGILSVNFTKYLYQ
ncbi:flagellar basal body-associated FliL family protein [Chitinilyticum piscinae]|uniref:Flagellar protein FliL n=1 Tax=Chitinilyticum piscinae TaxID=2866724 RepID=A0A8J7K8R0_9NEIS|nr:flagellar basal body-associated FliL family protein [Chitinilyticum piscinae]MBE9609958.1 flagellar basal body-associated FliL family protein [Chitinilyticum piscinae]